MEDITSTISSWVEDLRKLSGHGRFGIQQLLALALAVVITVIVTLNREELGNAATYGYLGIFVACFAANSTVLLPAPSSAIVLSFGAVYDPLWVGIAGGLGAATGELVGYLAGLSGHRVVENTEQVQRLKGWMEDYGLQTIFVFAFLPLPLFDLIGVTAGVLRLNFIFFFAPTVAGKVFKMLIYAYVGAGLIPLLEPFIKKVIGS